MTKDNINMTDENIDAIALRVVSRMVKLKSMEDWFKHVSKSDESWKNYQDLDLSEEESALGEAAKLMTLMNLCQENEQYEKCAIIRNRMDEVNKILKKYNQ